MHDKTKYCVLERLHYMSTWDNEWLGWVGPGRAGSSGTTASWQPRVGLGQRCCRRDGSGQLHAAAPIQKIDQKYFNLKP